MSKDTYFQQLLFRLHPFFKESGEVFVYGTPVTKRDGKKKRPQFLCLVKGPLRNSTTTASSNTNNANNRKRGMHAKVAETDSAMFNRSQDDEPYVYIIKTIESKREADASFIKHACFRFPDIKEIDGHLPSGPLLLSMSVADEKSYHWEIPVSYREGKLLFLEFLFKEIRKYFADNNHAGQTNSTELIIPIAIQNVPAELLLKYRLEHNLAPALAGIGVLDGNKLQTPNNVEQKRRSAGENRQLEEETKKQRETLMSVKPHEEEYICMLFDIFRTNRAQQQPQQSLKFNTDESDIGSTTTACQANASDFLASVHGSINNLEALNVNDLVVAHEHISKMFTRVDETIGKLDVLHSTLDKYIDTMDAVSETVSLMEEQSSQMKVRRRNLERMECEIAEAVSKLSFSIDDSNCLLNDDVSDVARLGNIEEAAFRLRHALDAPLPPGFEHLPAVRTSRRDLEKLQRKFTTRLFDHLSNYFIHLSNLAVNAVPLATQQQQQSSLSVPSDSSGAVRSSVRSHTTVRIQQTHTSLLKYANLLQWLSMVDADSHERLVMLYCQSMLVVYSTKFANNINNYKTAIIERCKVSPVASRAKHHQPQQQQLSSTTGSAAEAASSPTAATFLIGSDFLLFPSENDQLACQRDCQFFTECVLVPVITEIEYCCENEQRQLAHLFRMLPPPPHGGGEAENSVIDAGGDNSFAGGGDEIATNSSIVDSEHATVRSSATKTTKLSKHARNAAASNDSSLMTQHLSLIFKSMETQIGEFIEFCASKDPFFLVAILVWMHVSSVLKPSTSYSSQLFGKFVILAKRQFDRQIELQVKMLLNDNAKMPKKSRFGLLTCVENFGTFLQIVESTISGEFTNIVRKIKNERATSGNYMSPEAAALIAAAETDAATSINNSGENETSASASFSRFRTEVDRGCLKLLRAVVDAVCRVAAHRDLKSRPDVVLFENYYRLQDILRRVKNTYLTTIKDDIRERYMTHKALYVAEMLGQPMPRVQEFFDGVEKKITTSGIQPMEIQYTTQFSRQELSAVIKPYTAELMRKNLEQLYKKVEKNVNPDVGLLRVVWFDIQDEFLKQFDRYSIMLAQCYANTDVQFGFDRQQLIGMFRKIAEELM